MNGYLSQIAVRAGGVVTPHSLTPVRQLQGPFTPRQMGPGSEVTSVLPSPVAVPSLGEAPSVMPLPEQAMQRVIPEATPQQEIKPVPQVRYLERYLERAGTGMQADKQLTAETTPFVNMQTSTAPVVSASAITNITPVKDAIINTPKGNEKMPPVVIPSSQEPPIEDSVQRLVPAQDHPKEIIKQNKEEATTESIQPQQQRETTVTTLHQPPVNIQPPTVLTPRVNADTPAPQGKKPVPPKVTIGRITVEVVVPPPVQTVTRNKPRSAGPPVPAPGSNDIHKLSFGFGQL